MAENKNRRETPLHVMLPVGFATLNVAVFASVLLAMHVNWGLGLSAIIFLFTTMLISTAWSGLYMLFSAFAALVAGLIGVIFMAEARFVEKGEVARNILPHQAADYPNANCFYFKDAKVRRDLAGHFSSTNKQTTSHYYAAPVVDSQWTPSKKVVVWAVDSNFYEWKKEHRAGIRESMGVVYEDAVQNAVRKHGLKSHNAPVFLQWTADPLSIPERNRTWFLGTLSVVNGIWLVLILTRGRRQSGRR